MIEGERIVVKRYEWVQIPSEALNARFESDSSMDSYIIILTQRNKGFEYLLAKLLILNKKNPTLRIKQSYL